MMEILLNFAHQAGNLMIDCKKKSKSLGNKDTFIGSIVTDTDILISNLFEKLIAENFSNLNYIIIDEEKITRYGDTIFDKINESEYQFVVDPIDGTIQFAHGHPLYGITIGVYHHAKPLIGLIYMPQIHELVYFDGKQCIYAENAFLPNETKTEIKPNVPSASPVIFGSPWVWHTTPEFPFDKLLFLTYYSAVSQSLYTLVGKAQAYFMKLHIWDIAGTFPIAEYLGFKIFEYGSNKIYDKISADYFTTGMSTKGYCIMCYPEDYHFLSSILMPIKNSI